MALCDCFNITEKKLRDAIAKKGLSDVDQVYEAFDASPCGSCTDEIQRVLDEAQEK